ncbi:MAG: cation-translocating P-type ATPase [Paracoccaceae bacterium]|nr:MAG: cation-translocating P-type ATPase [Paracoccaceae bacterium]
MADMQETAPLPWEGADGALTLATVAGLALGLVDAFWLAGPWGPAGLILAFAAGGIPAALSALRALFRQGRIDIDLLMVVAALAAAAVGAALEGAVLLALFSASGTLEHRAMGRARRAVEALMDLRPEVALIRRGDAVTEIPAGDLRPGDVVVLRPGARVPVDGVLVQGEGRLDESTLTGEALPVAKGPGAPVFEATVNLHSVLEMRVTRPPADSTVARMIALVSQAQAARAPSQRFSDWFGQRYTIAVLAGSGIALAAFRLSGLPWDDALYRAATLLVAASPCAVVISVPAAILSALAAAARGGVLFKGGAALEMMAEVRAFAFDKTGTLTHGTTTLSGFVARDPAGDLATLAGLEAQAEHHIALAVRRHADMRGIGAAAVRDVRTIPSEGVVGRLDGATVWAGNGRLARRMGADPAALPGAATLVDGDATVIWAGRDAEVRAAATFADSPRASALPALAALRRRGVALTLMTGDRAVVAGRVGAAIGLAPDEIRADLLPEDKLRLVGALAAGGRVAFVGDGVNDAAALARADVGIAMGAAGSDVALQAADVALMSGDLMRLVAAHRLSLRTRAVIRQNLVISLGAMAVLVAGSVAGVLPLPLAVIGHEGGTLLVVLNGLRLLADPVGQAARGFEPDAGDDRETPDPARPRGAMP